MVYVLSAYQQLQTITMATPSLVCYQLGLPLSRFRLALCIKQ